MCPRDKICQCVFNISDGSLVLANPSSLDMSGTALKLTPTDVVVISVGTVVNFTCSYNSAIPMEIDMHTRPSSSDPSETDAFPDTWLGPYVNYTGGAKRTLVVRIRSQLAMVVCSLYDKLHKVQRGQISTWIKPGAIAKNNG